MPGIEEQSTVGTLEKETLFDRVVTSEGEINGIRNRLTDIDDAIAHLRDNMDKVIRELGLT